MSRGMRTSGGPGGPTPLLMGMTRRRGLLAPRGPWLMMLLLALTVGAIVYWLR